MLFSVQVCLPGSRVGCPPPMEGGASPSHTWEGCTLVVSAVQARTTFLKLGVVIFFDRSILSSNMAAVSGQNQPAFIEGIVSVYSEANSVPGLPPRRYAVQKEGVFSDQKCLSGVWLSKCGSQKLRDILSKVCIQTILLKSHQWTNCPWICLTQWAEDKWVSNSPLCTYHLNYFSLFQDSALLSTSSHQW